MSPPNEQDHSAPASLGHPPLQPGLPAEFWRRMGVTPLLVTSIAGVVLVVGVLLHAQGIEFLTPIAYACGAVGFCGAIYMLGLVVMWARRRAFEARHGYSTMFNYPDLRHLWQLDPYNEGRVIRRPGEPVLNEPGWIKDHPDWVYKPRLRRLLQQSREQKLRKTTTYADGINDPIWEGEVWWRWNGKTWQHTDRDTWVEITK